MKYDINSTMPNDWCKDQLVKFLFDIKDKIFNKMFKNTRYMIGRHKLLKNDGIVENDQKPHADYPIRSSKK